MKIIAGIFIVFLIFVVITGISGCSDYNGLVGSSQACDRQWGQVQNVYQRRADLVPNLVSTVQGAANFEKSTLTDVIKARASATSVTINPGTAPTDPAQLKQFQDAQGQLTSSLSRLLVTVEKYPDLKSNQNFLELQAQLEGTENRIATERERFNQVVQDYDTQAQRFPGVIFARMFGFQPKPYFTADVEAQHAPTVNFNFSGSPAAAPAATPAATPAP